MPRFVDVSRQAGIDGTDLGQAATWWDYDSDGDPDLYVANDYWGPDRLYRNNGNGTFTDVAKQSLPHTPWSSMGVDVADINGDLAADVVYPSGDGIGILLGCGDGTFAGPLFVAFERELTQVFIADLDENSAPDLVSASEVAGEIWGALSAG